MRSRNIRGVTFRFVSPSFALLAFLLAVTLPVRGQQPSWTIVGPAFSASVEDLQKAAASVPAEKFMEATMLFERDAYTIDAQGRVTYQHTMIYRIETESGVEGWAETDAPWEPWYQNQPEIRARVIGADGKVSMLDQKTVTEGPASEDDESTYTDGRVRKAPLPAIAIGAIVEEQTTTTDKSPFFLGGGIYSDNFSRNVPIIHVELVIDAPKELNLQYRVHLMPSVKITDEVHETHQLKFLEENVSAHESSDIELPTHNITGPMVEFSTGSSWAAVASAYRELAEAHIDPEKVKPLLPAVVPADRMAAIQLLVARLHKDIRYTGVEFGQASLQPATAAEIIKRHYGDCKDKAALLVAMLRAAGIPASLALLDTGPGTDVTPEMAGMNEFDHAIVYVPPPAVGEPLWIDATAEYAQVGTLPSMDEGRMALIVAEGTAGLTLTPTAKAEDDQLTELRDVAMAEYGPAHIAETSLTHGEIDASYREDFGGEETREKKANLEKYAKDGYLAKNLVSVDHGDGKDLAKPFVLKLEMSEAKRANTTIDDAGVAIPFSDIFGRLPQWFKTDPKVEGEKLTPQQEDDRKRAVEARTSEYDVHPLATEWRYTITPPAGFLLRALPENKVTEMGPAKLTQHYDADSAGVIRAVFHFETGKPRYTVDEALALRDAVLAAYKQDMIEVMFDLAGSKLMAAGKTREALAADRALIEKHPTEALHHAQIANAFLHAGMGGKARLEAERATRLDPKSKIAFQSLGWICQFNDIGIQFARGFDWDCAAAAYKKAMQIDPDDSDTAINLAMLDEYDRDGERYTPNAHLADAIRTFRGVKEKDKSLGDQYDDNILFDLLYSGQYKELLDELAKLSSTVTRQGLTISATVAMQGGAKGITAGIDRADRLAAGADARASALATAGTQLLHLRMYAEATGILSAGVEGQSNSAGVAQQIALFRDLKPWKEEFLPAGDPRSVVQHMFAALLTSAFTDKTANEVLTRHAYGSDAEWQRNIEKMKATDGLLHALSAQTKLPANVLLDVMTGNLKLTVEGDDDTGHHVSMQSLGSKTQQFFVTKESGAYKIVTDGVAPAESGNEALYLLHDGRFREAKSLLDWARDRMHRGGGDDQLSGPLLPRFWTVGDPPDPAVMQLAAASLVASDAAIKDLLPALRASWEKATAEDARLNLALLLAYGYSEAEDGANLKAISSEILKEYPDSYVAINLAGDADGMLKNWKPWSDMIEAQLARHPDDESLLHMKIQYAEAKSDFALARATEQALMDKGKATAGDYNNYAWLGLFDDKVDADSVKNAQQATMMTNNGTFPELHTLACIYAHQGNTAEARDELLKAMAVATLSEPNSEAWYGFGSIYEQYGVNDAAIEAFKKVERPEGRIGTASTYALAQSRLKDLESALK